MKKLEYNARTGETVEIEIEEAEIEGSQTPGNIILDPKMQAIEEIEAATTIAGLRAAMLKFINAS